MVTRRIRLLVVDDDVQSRAGLEKLLGETFAVDVADGAAAALSLAAEHAPDVVITDLAMPDVDGMELMRKLHEIDRDLPVIVSTGAGDVALAVSAMRAGAEDYLTKPIDYDALVVAIERAVERRSLRAEAENCRRQLRTQSGERLEGLVGTSAVMQQVYRVAKQVSGARATVLITGESGTGKGELARVIHELGPNSKQPFVQLHCAALAQSLLESELFGHEKGSFTGADKRRIGRIEQANGGTLFLDEIGEIPPLTQVKLLRVLQERTFERVGGNEPITVNVRIIAATNRDLVQDVRDGRFREDLYYRLNVVRVEMPALRLRNDDVMLLAHHFLHRFTHENHKPIAGFTDAAQRKIIAYGWPGNVRELENAIERAVVLCEGASIDEGALPVSAASATSGNKLCIPGATMAEIERGAILATLDACNGSTAKAAEVLQISVRTIQYRLHEYGRVKRDRSTDDATAA